MLNFVGTKEWKETENTVKSNPVASAESNKQAGNWLSGLFGLFTGEGFLKWLPAVTAGYDIYNSERNYRSEQDAYAYQKELNDIERMREDTAVQRRAADMQAAGFSQTLAAGSPAESSSQSSGEAPQRRMSAVEKFMTMANIERIKNDIDLQGIDKIIRHEDYRVQKANADYLEYENAWLKNKGMIKNGDSIIGKNIRSAFGIIKDSKLELNKMEKQSSKKTFDKYAPVGKGKFK